MSRYPHPGFLVWNPEANLPKVRHLTMGEARREAERLAKQHPGQRFFVMAPEGAAIVPPPVQWVPIDDPDFDTPF